MTDDRVFAKCAWRLIPFMMLLYVVNFIDRVNVGFAALTMNKDLGFSPAIFGFGAGVFFIGYLLFQVPANVILERVGARRWIFCILVVWGAISAANAFVQGPTSFYALRFLLGVAEAGFFPGMIFYLTLWFPQAYRARFTASFMAAIPLAGIIGGPLSGLILGMDGVAGLHGWQWLFLIEGLPACLLAFAVLKLLPDGPAHASWLSGAEKKRLPLASPPKTSWRIGTFGRPCAIRACLRSASLFGIVMIAFYGTSLWLPQIVQAMGFSNRATGFVVALPYVAGMAAMILWGRSSDARGERIWHVALPMLLAAAGFAGASVAQTDPLVLVALTLSMVGIVSAYGPFWSLPSSFLRGSAAAGGIALINTIASLGGFVGPSLIGVLKEQTGGYASAMAACCLLGLCWPPSSSWRSGARWRRVRRWRCRRRVPPDERRPRLRQMRVAADPVHDAALCGQFRRPPECRVCRADHEQGFGLFAHGFRFWRGRLLCGLRTVPSARQCDPRTRGRAALDFLHPGGLGFAVGIERVGAKPNEFLRGAFSLGRGGGRVVSPACCSI